VGGVTMMATPTLTAPTPLGSAGDQTSQRWEEHPYLPPGWTRSNLQRLHDMIDKSTRSLAKYREEWVKMIEYTAGSHYNGGRSKKSRPLNPLRMAISTYVSRLAGNVPRCRVDVENVNLAPQAYNLEFDTNRRLKTIEYLDEFQEAAILEAIIGASVAKVTVELTEQVMVDGIPVWKKRPKLDLVDSEDIILDLPSKRSWCMRYIGNRYLADLDEVLADERYDETCKGYLRRSRGNRRGDGPIPWEQQPLGVAGNEQHDRDDDLTDQVRLMDVYLPKYKWMLTLVEGAPHLPPLWGRKWYACDPYIPLVFERVAGNVLPMPIGRHWYDLAQAVDNAYAKLINQCKRQKTIAEVQSKAKNAAEILRDTPDGGAYATEFKDAIREVSYGGPNQINFAFAIHLKQLNNFVANNIELIAGLGPTGVDTATEVSILSAGSNAGLASMQRKIRNWWAKILQAIAWYSYHDELYEPEIERGNRSLGLVVYEPWSYQERARFDFFQFMFDIQPQSNTYQTPEQKLAAIKRVLIEIYAPFMQLAMQQGVQLNMADLFKEVAQLSNLEPELKNMLMRAEIPDPQPMSQDTGPFKADVPKVYTHQSRPSQKTNRGQEEVLMSELLGSARQRSER